MGPHQFLLGLRSPSQSAVLNYVRNTHRWPFEHLLTCLSAIPPSSGYTAIGLGIASVLTLSIKVGMRYFQTEFR